MPDWSSYPAAAVLALSGGISLLIICSAIAFIAISSVFARSPGSRRHSRAVLQELTKLVAILRRKA